MPDCHPPLHRTRRQLTVMVARDPKAGDVIIFNPAAGATEQKQYFWQQDPVFIKRVVAVGGDEVEVWYCPEQPGQEWHHLSHLLASCMLVGLSLRYTRLSCRLMVIALCCCMHR